MTKDFISFVYSSYQRTTTTLFVIVIILQVLEAGRLKEFDAPYSLLKNPATIFAQLVGQTGPVESRRLLEIARNKYYADKTIPEAEDDLPDAESNRESVDGSQSSAALNIIVPDDQSPAGAFQFESTV